MMNSCDMCGSEIKDEECSCGSWKSAEAMKDNPMKLAVEEFHEMKSFIPHRILVINDQIVTSKDEETLGRCYQLAFDWANRMGMEGKRVFDLYLQRPDPNKDSRNIRCQSYLWCKIECTMEDREIWEKTQKLNIEHAVWNALK